VPCRACGAVPTGDERTLAWLLSDHHLSPTELAEAARNIRGGERLDPPEELLAKARAGLAEAIPGRRRRPKQVPPMRRDHAQPEPPGASEPAATWAAEPSLAELLALDTAGPPGGRLPGWALAVLALVSILATPLPGWVAWGLWRKSAPQAARQVLRIVGPISAGFALAWALLLGFGWGGRWGLF